MDFIKSIYNAIENNKTVTVLGENQDYSFNQILKKIYQLNTLLSTSTEEVPNRILVLTQNSLDWVISDFYCLFKGITEVSIPLSFSVEQTQSLLEGIDLVLVDKAGDERLKEWLEQGLKFDDSTKKVKLVNHLQLNLLEETPFELNVNKGPIKIIHTSGSTGNPKGVMISNEGLSNLIFNLNNRLPESINERYLSIVPLSLLIEQVALYLTILRGGEIVLPGNVFELLGEGTVQASQFLDVIKLVQPTSMAIPPSIAKSMYDFSERVKDKSQVLSLLFGKDESPFFTCGGAPVSSDILLELNRIGITIYEGYGLSENASVVSINVPSANKIGTVGKPLDHVQVKLAEDGELLVKSSSMFLGYSNNQDSTSCEFTQDGWLKTGDFATIDHEGYITILGRKKNIIINSHGRNIAPEWLENQYKNLVEIEDIVVFNNEAEFLEVLITRNENHSEEACIKAIKSFQIFINSYGEIGRFHFMKRSEKSFYYTVSGKPNRTKISTNF